MNAAHRLLWALRALLGAVLLFSGSAHALIPKVSGWQMLPPGGNGLVISGPSKADVFSQANTWWLGKYPSGSTKPENATSNYLFFCYGAGGTNCPLAGEATQPTGGYCPANSTSVTGGCQCNSGYLEQNGQCVQNQCGAKLGVTRIVRWTIGYVRSPDDDDYKYVGGGPNIQSGNVCVEGCSYGVGAAVKGWRSQTPTDQGLYRLSVDVESTGLGSACTASATAPENPSAPEPQCPGYVGEVNGKKGCYGTAQKPVLPVNVPGSMPSNTVAGNPAAGARPTSGEGSGNDGPTATPTNGSGGNAGGPAAAAAGGRGGGAGGTASGTGTTTKPGEGEEQQACGAPGQPICEVNIAKPVKINEDGTPGASGVQASNQTAIDKLNAKADERETGLSNVTKVPEGGTGWGFVPQWLSSNDCTPWNLGTLPIIDAPLRVDICEIQPYAVLIMTFFWVVGTIFAITSMVGRVMGSGVA
ncbi:MAG: hypothetical protein INR62_05120 [Rhodospirillales bacterium]|nr:hypothetical protein [Acetobacter sp.]